MIDYKDKEKALLIRLLDAKVKKVEKLATALKVIRTWASVSSKPEYFPSRGLEALRDIELKAQEALDGKGDN